MGLPSRSVRELAVKVAMDKEVKLPLQESMGGTEDHPAAVSDDALPGTIP